MRRNLIVIGASAGGVEALSTVVSELPRDLPASVLVVLHIPPYGNSVLPAILTRAGRLGARHPNLVERLVDGAVYIAPPDQHLVVNGDELRVTRGARENGHRPSVDVLFRSAARSAGNCVIGVILSGVLDDGAAGLAAIRARGGVGVVQDPRSAVYPGMPSNAIRYTDPEFVLPAEQIAEVLVRLCTEDVPRQPSLPVPLLDFETEFALMNDDAGENREQVGPPSGFSCPDCSGVLWQVPDPTTGVVRYRCRVGHAWSGESLLGEQTQQLETALWMALRGLEEKAALAHSLGEQAKTRNRSLSADRFALQAEDAARAATLIRRMLEAHVGLPNDDLDTG